MKDRIRQVMEAQHMSQQVFAQFIEMSPASLSSIFSGRTRPTLNIVEAIKKKIPNINIEWLLFGTGTMFDSAPSAPTHMEGREDGEPVESTLNFDMEPPATSPASTTAMHGLGHPHAPRQEVVREEIKFVEKPQRKVMEIRVYYDDLTFETFVPAKK